MTVGSLGFCVASLQSTTMGAILVPLVGLTSMVVINIAYNN